MFKHISPLVLIAIWMSVAPLWAATGVADLRGTAPGSPIQGTIKLSDTPNGLQLFVTVSSVPAGDHGFHIHEFGSCADLAKAAGGHYNPSSLPHGNVLKDGPHKAHAGDMGNLKVDAKGTGSITLVIPDVTLAGSTFPVGGRAIVMHEKADDFGQPVGNAGGRIACGTILITGN